MILYLNTYEKESPLSLYPNSSQETAPIETYDISFDSSWHVVPQHGVRFPEIFAILELNPGIDWGPSSLTIERRHIENVVTVKAFYANCKCFHTDLLR